MRSMLQPQVMQFMLVRVHTCLLYTSDAADDLLCVDLGGRRIIKKKNKTSQHDETKYVLNVYNREH